MRLDIVTISQNDDWKQLRQRKATTVIDPMVVRVADLFARGGRDDPDNWKIIKNNIAGLATFVDALILESGIPVFDYWATGGGWARDQRIFDYTEPVVVPVGVKSEVWGPLSGDAAIAMGKNPSLPGSGAAQIAANLQEMGWDFIPEEFGGIDHSDTRTAGDPSGNALVNSYLYVSLLFAAYAAQLSDGDHPGTQVLSPGQTEILVAAAVAEAGRNAPVLSSAMFGTINDVINQSRPGYERTWQSERLHFLPHLLAMEDTPGRKKIRTSEQLFREALALRGRPDISDYRDRLNRARATMEHGEDDDAWDRELQRTAIAVQTALKVKPSIRHLQISIGFPQIVQISGGMNIGALSWLISAWPGKRYRRVLTRLALAQAKAKQIDRRLEAIWRAS
jgi:hypothetical protein